MFAFDRDDLAGDEYEAWLRQAISARSAASDEEFASFANLVMRHGSNIRERMRREEDFRQRFRGELWPRLTRVVASKREAFEHYLDDERIWVLLAHDNGEATTFEITTPVQFMFRYSGVGRESWRR